MRYLSSDTNYCALFCRSQYTNERLEFGSPEMYLLHHVHYVDPSARVRDAEVKMQLTQRACHHK